MSDPGASARGWSRPRGDATVALVTRVGGATGSSAAAAALAAVAAEPDRAALLIDLDDGRPSRPSLVATAGARELEERIAAHIPNATVASRGQICLMRLPGDPEGVERLPAVLPLVREAVAVIHLPPSSLQPLLAEPRIRSTAALLRADLAADRSLAALAARDLIARGLRVAVLKRPPSWLATRCALLGAPPIAEAIPSRLSKRLLELDSQTGR